MDFHDPCADLFPHTEQSKQCNQMQRKIFHQLNHRVFPEKKEPDFANTTVELAIGKSWEVALQDKKEENIKIHPFVSSTSSTCLSHKQKKSRKPQNPEALVQPPRKLLKTPESERPGLTFFVVTFRQHCPMNNPTAFSRLRGDDLRTFDYNGKNVALTEATKSRKAKKKDNFPLKCLFYQITGDPEPLLLARNN